MFSQLWPWSKESVLDPVIAHHIDEMNSEEPGSAKYSKMAGELKLLLEAKAVEPKADKLSVNTAVVVAGNLAGILLILIFERKNVITTKSLTMLPKLRS